MRWVIGVIGTAIVAIGAIALAGYFLPVGHEASRTAEFSRPPAEVHALVSKLQDYPAWWPEAATAVEIVENMPPTRLVTRIVGETAFGGTWTMAIEPTPGGSRLTITERGEIYNPIFRTLARFVFGYTSTMDSCLEAVARELNRSSPP